MAETRYDFRMPDTPKNLVMGTYEKITVSTTAIGITASIRTPTEVTAPNFVGFNAKAIYVVVTANDIFWRADGTNPTSSTGIPAYADSDGSSAFVLYGSTNIKNFRMIRASADASVYVACFF